MRSEQVPPSIPGVTPALSPVGRSRANSLPTPRGAGRPTYLFDENHHGAYELVRERRYDHALPVI